MKYLTVIAIFLSLFVSVNAAETISPDDAFKRLVEGNNRFVKDKLTHCFSAADKREATAEQQRPFAVVLGCSDSRVPPEFVFDQSVGALFVIRVAGNVLGPLELDSIEYSILVNGSSIVVVLGHENCGAVKAVMENTVKDIESVAALIKPAIANVMKQGDVTVAEVVKANVKAVKNQLLRSSVVEQAMKEKRLKVVGAYYELNSGRVTFLGE